ncbi:enolase C-terminal domain-like protein [Streptomyces sp. NPDC055144]
MPGCREVHPFLQIMQLADCKGLALAPHFVMEIRSHLAAAYPSTAWVEHFEWLEPMFNERLEIADGRLVFPNRRGFGLPLSDQRAAWTVDSIRIG